jgi:peptide/nickel transport system permease protein
MSAADGRAAARGPLRQLLATGAGRVGAVLLLLLAAVSVVVVATYPANFGPARWANPAAWADHPKAAPPVWADLLSRGDRAPHRVLAADAPAEVEPAGDAAVQRYVLAFDHHADDPPAFLSVSLGDVVFDERAPSVTVALHRPDGHEAVLYRAVLAGESESGEIVSFDRGFDRVSGLRRIEP